MSYQITKGIAEKDLPNWLNKAAEKYGQFPDGRVDYTNADTAPIVMCTVYCKGKLLLVKRGYGLADANGYWSTINGFIDEIRPLNLAVTQELQEELGLKIAPKKIQINTSYTLNSANEKRTYIVFPCLLVLDTQHEIRLNEENTEFAWIRRTELKNYHILDDLSVAIDTALAML